jgi:hypothetical protein
LSISKGREKKVLVFFQKPDGTLMESRFNLVFKFKVLATIFRVGFVMLPGILVLPHFERQPSRAVGLTHSPML